MTLIIHDRSELPQLLTSREPRVRFEIPNLTERENEDLHNRLGTLYEECGCVQATIGLLVGIGVAIGIGAIASLGWLSIVMLATGLGLTTSLVAKFSSMRIARFRLSRAVDLELRR